MIEYVKNIRQIEWKVLVAITLCIIGKFDKENAIIGGYPAEIIRKKICWEG